MPYESTPVTGTYFIYYNEFICKPPTFSSNSANNYTSYARQYNNPIRRVKPDPLTPTALPLQYTLRRKQSILGYFPEYNNGWDTACSPWKKFWRHKQVRGIAGNAETLLPYTLDWESKFLGQVQDEVVNIGSSLAEYRATADTFVRYAKGVKNGWDRFRGLKKGRAKLTPCSIPAAELAYSFGIAPLAEDLYSSVEALRLRLQLPIYKKVHVTSTAHQRASFSQTGYYDCSKRQRVSKRADAIVELKPSNYSVLTFGNPVSWAWELVPFSFVVDWGIPIGQWLQDMDTIRLIQGVSGTLTEKRAMTGYYRKDDARRGSYQASLGKYSYKSHRRDLITSVPVPPLPRWKPSFSWHKLYRAVTLLIAVNQPCRKYSGRRR